MSETTPPTAVTSEMPRAMASLSVQCRSLPAALSLLVTPTCYTIAAAMLLLASRVDAQSSPWAIEAGATVAAHKYDSFASDETGYGASAMVLYGAGRGAIGIGYRRLSIDYGSPAGKGSIADVVSELRYQFADPSAQSRPFIAASGAYGTWKDGASADEKFVSFGAVLGLNIRIVSRLAFQAAGQGERTLIASGTGGNDNGWLWGVRAAIRIQ